MKKLEVNGMFYEKDCNYAFNFNHEKDFNVFFIKNKEDRNKDICDLLSDHYNNVDTCILWAGYQLFIETDWKFNWERIVIQNADAKIEMEFKTQDELIEAIWETLTDVNIDEDECTEQNWFVFPIGTYIDDIWHWIDERHSKGVGWLINEYER